MEDEERVWLEYIFIRTNIAYMPGDFSPISRRRNVFIVLFIVANLLIHIYILLFCVNKI